MPVPRIHVDRVDQLDLIRSLIEKDDERGALVLVQAPQDMGKSALLDELIRRIGEAAFAWTDLAGFTEIEGILSDIYREFSSQRLPLPTLADRRAELADDQGINVINSTVRGSSFTRLANVAAMVRRQERSLLEALAQDLSEVRAKKKVVMVDSCEQADDACLAWLATEFVPVLLSVRNIVIILAGRELPALRSKDLRHAVDVDLPSLSIDDAVEWLTAIGAAIRPDHLSVTAHIVQVVGDGVPGKMAGLIKTLSERGWAPS